MFKRGKTWTYMAIAVAGLAFAAFGTPNTAVQAATATEPTASQQVTAPATSAESAATVESATTATPAASQTPAAPATAQAGTDAGTASTAPTTEQAATTPATTPATDAESAPTTDPATSTDSGQTGDDATTDDSDAATTDDDDASGDTTTEDQSGDATTTGDQPETSTGDAATATTPATGSTALTPAAANHLYDYLTKQLTYAGIDPTTETLDAIVKDYYAQQEKYVKTGDFTYGDFSTMVANDAFAQWQSDTAMSIATMFNSKYYDASEPPVDADSLYDGGALQALQAGYTGAGTVVAVIDDGVEPQKDLRLSDPDSAEAKANAQKAKDFIAKNGYGTYVNDKIIFAYNYSSNSDQNTYTAEEDHGEHVAGIIAANGEKTGNKLPTATDLQTLPEDDLEAALVASEDGPARYTVGVAPEAQLLDLRIIDDAGSQSNDTLARAIYDAVALGANVINMSIGNTYLNNDPDNPTVQAIKYAMEHGVFVVVAASNSDSRANVGAAGGKDYTPENYSTISNPATTDDAMTVAAEDTFDLMTYLTTQNRTMAPFSSVGPLADFTLKPDITAPGSNIKSTEYEDQYQIMQGTSMATPYISGAAAVLMQYMKAEHPEVTGSALVQTIKLLLMNSAQLNYEPDDMTIPLSPRQQGAGSVQVYLAESRSVTAEGTTADGTPTGVGSQSLYTVADGDQFTIHLNNFGTDAATYTIDPGTVLTSVFDKGADGKLTGAGTTHEEAVAGATIDGPTTVTVDAGGTADVTFTLHFDASVAKNQAVEGYLTFSVSDPKQTIHVPYLGFYGDLTEEDVFDNTGRGLINYLQDNNQLPLGIGSSSDAVKALADNGNTTFANGGNDAAAVQGAVALADPTKAAISPNGDGENDTVAPVIYTTQNLKTLTVEIVDADGNVIRTLDHETNLEGGGTSAYGENNDPVDIRMSTSVNGHPTALNWDGTVYDPTTGTQVAAADGQYFYKVIGTLNYPGAKQTQSFELPITVDTSAPTITAAAFDAATQTVGFDYSDTGIGFTKNTQVTVTIGDADSQVALNASAASGHFTATLTAAQVAALTASDGQIGLTLHDAAGNAAEATVDSGVAANATTTTAADTETPTFHFYTTGTDLSQVQMISLDGAGITTDAFGAAIAWTNETGKAILKAHVSGPAGTQYFIRDVITGAVYTGTPDANGDILFTVDDINDAAAMSFSFGGGLYLGYGIAPTSEAGVYKMSTTDASFVVAGDNTGTLVDQTNATLLAPSTDYEKLRDMLKDPATENLLLFYNDGGYTESHNKANWLNQLNYYIEEDRNGQGHIIDLAHAQAFSQGYTGSEFSMPEQDVLTFDNAQLSNQINATGVLSTAQAAAADATTATVTDTTAGYDAAAGTYTITGHVATSGDSVVYGKYHNAGLYILGNSSSEADPANRVTLDADGNFSYTVKIGASDNKAIGYALVLQQINDDGSDGEVQIYRNALVFTTDTVAPTLEVPNIQATGDGVTVLTTSADHMDVDATANDDSDDFTLTVNGSQLLRQKSAETDGDTGVNQFGAASGETSVPLQYGRNILTIVATDQLGNTTNKTYVIERVDATFTTADTPNLSSQASKTAETKAKQAAYATGFALGKTNSALPDLSGQTSQWLTSFVAGYNAGLAAAKQAAATPAATTPAQRPTQPQQLAAKPAAKGSLKVVATAQPAQPAAAALPQAGDNPSGALALAGVMVLTFIGSAELKRRVEK